ncbi:DUF2931 family protein [Saccharicrinis aurantiacus]|uniref:DUF2931 family protein n=1 Tax=Saccharicrinis aurantiacus TaxID=1849719 RepID=UPI00249396C1|nr:DUF2931 family protein [Saccharicrinis aurantiacus]
MALNIFACNASQKKEQAIKLDWQPGVNAPKHYPIRTVFGSFSNGERTCGITTGICQNGGWGLGGKEMTTGRFVPNKLTLGWFSHAEDKFYKGEFNLPADTLEALFKQGFIGREGTHFRYNYFIVNAYPKGGVALWMQVGGDRIVEIAHFQGEEMEYNWKSMYPYMTKYSREEYNQVIMERAKGSLEYIAQHGITQEPFKTIFRQRYNYTISLDSVPHNKTIHIMTEFFNGEMDTMLGDELEHNFFKNKAVTKYISFRWVKDKVVYYGQIYFDAKEMYDLFDKMSTECPDEPYVMHLKPNYDTRKLTVTLSSSTQEIEIQRTGKIGKSSSQKEAELF